MAKDDSVDLVTSAFFRFMKVGSLFGKVGFSLVGNKMLNMFMGKESREKRIIENFIKNGDRIFDALGKLKGGVMKIGQMLSLQEGLLPPEVMKFLRMLQKEAPAIEFSQMEKVLENEIPHYKNKTKSLDKNPYASASIGQVHTAVLNDETKVAIKIQYPNVDKAIKADLKNLKILFKLLISIFSKANFDPIWQELEERLLEEIDYTIELKNQMYFKKIFVASSILQIANPVEDLCSHKVLTTTFIAGDNLDYVVENYSQQQKNIIGENLIKIFLEQLFGNNVVHADPNAGNYAFTKDGKVILYDFGCVKYLPYHIVTTYALIVNEFYNKRYKEIPRILQKIELQTVANEPIKEKIVETFYDFFHQIFLDDHYQFGLDNKLFEKLKDVGRQHFGDSLEIQVPKDIIFLHRSFEGLFGNLSRLKSKANFGILVQQAIQERI